MIFDYLSVCLRFKMYIGRAVLDIKVTVLVQNYRVFFVNFSLNWFFFLALGAYDQLFITS